MEWPQPTYPGDIPDVGHDQAMELYDEVPSDKRVYTFEEVLGMVSALGTLPENTNEWREWLDGHVEHMATGGYVIGMPDPRG